MQKFRTWCFRRILNSDFRFPRSPCSCSVVSNPMSHFRATTAQFAPAIRNTFSDGGLNSKRNFSKSEKWMNRHDSLFPLFWKQSVNGRHFFNRNFETAEKSANENSRGTPWRKKKEDRKKRIDRNHRIREAMARRRLVRTTGQVGRCTWRIFGCADFSRVRSARGRSGTATIG